MKNLEKDKDHLTINLLRAEEEVCELVYIDNVLLRINFQVVLLIPSIIFFQVNVLFEENNILNKENKKLMRQCIRDKHIGGSGGSSSASGKVWDLE